jgi:hypothetical protein
LNENKFFISLQIDAMDPEAMQTDDNQRLITENLIALREKVDSRELEANFCAGAKQKFEKSTLHPVVIWPCQL